MFFSIAGLITTTSYPALLKESDFGQVLIRTPKGGLKYSPRLLNCKAEPGNTLNLTRFFPAIAQSAGEAEFARNIS
jgi:hypothetical protein